MADWSTLPCDILGEVALKLDQLVDFIYFSAVCHSWNHASSLVKLNWNAKTVMPWLFLVENTTDNPDCIRKMYNLSNHRPYPLKAPETFGSRCWGSRYGWIVLQSFDFQVHLFNPLTKVRSPSLPSIQPLSRKFTFRKFVTRFVVLKLPQSKPLPLDGVGGAAADNLLVAMIYGDGCLAFACPGDLAWIYIDSKISDVACWGDLIYIVDDGGLLRYCNIKGIRDFNNLKFVDYVPRPNLRFKGWDTLYLLDLGGDIIMVERMKEDLIGSDDDELDGEVENNPQEFDHELDGEVENNPQEFEHELDPEVEGNPSKFDDDYDCEEFRDEDSFPTFHCCTSGFHVYKLDSNSKKWVKINEIGNFSIFVGIDSSLSVPTSTTNNYKSNSIYFTDDMIKVGDSRFGGVDMGVYNMDSRDITNFYQGDDDLHSRFGPPIFFVPNC